MRICLLTREYASVTPYAGGIGTKFAALAPALAGEGHDVHVLVLGSDSGGASIEGVRFHFVPGAGGCGEGPAGRLTVATAASKWLSRAETFDVLYAPDWGGEAAFCDGRRKPSLVTNLAGSLKQVRKANPATRRLGDVRPQRLVQSFLERRQAERSRAIIAPSSAVLDSARVVWPRLVDVPTAVIPNPMNLEVVRAGKRGEPPAGFPLPGPPVISFAGRLEHRKGVDVLVEAMRSVWGDWPDARLVLMGRDAEWRGRSMSDRLRELAGEWARQVIFLGEQSPERVCAGFAASTIVALPSIWESFGNVVLEALAVGSAVVTTHGGGPAEFVDDKETGVLVTPGSREELAAALLFLLEDRSARERLAHAATRSVERFEAAPIARRHADFFASLAA